MKALSVALLFATAAGVVACGNARTPDKYRDDTAALLATKNDSIKGCYDAALKVDKAQKGEVTLKFVVQEDTGKIVKAAVVPDKTTAPEALSKCVLDAVGGLVLAPPDAKEGQATFLWEFTVRGG
ncbi:MAG: hypothetical protein IT373_30505 [Polyangiaceae bacterium]|nr:hypothetical protein [Polyangiaceae bacterium]